MTVRLFGYETSSYFAGTVTIPVPARTEEGDVLLAVVGIPNVIGSMSAPDGWEVLGALTGGTTARCYLFRRIADEFEPASYDFIVAPSPATDALGVMALFRGMDPNGVLRSSSKSDFAAPVAQIGVPVSYDERSDLVLGVAFTTGTAINHDWTVDPYEFVEKDGSNNTMSLGYETGVLGPASATIDVNLSANRAGIGAGFLLSAAPLQGVEKTLPATPKRVGLPLVGA